MVFLARKLRKRFRRTEATGKEEETSSSSLCSDTPRVACESSREEEHNEIDMASQKCSTPAKKAGDKAARQPQHFHRTSPISPVAVAPPPVVGGTTSHVVTPSPTPSTTTSLYPQTDVQRSKQLAEKRVQLCRKRVHLEQSLFEFAELQRQKQQPVSWHAVPSSLSVSLSSSSSPPNASSVNNNNNNTPSLSDTTNELPSTLMSLQWQAVQFPDGQIYKGQVLIQLPKNTTSNDNDDHNNSGRLLRHGHGTNRWPDGQVYRGAWQYNSRSGRGTHTWPDGRSVTGPWRQGHLHGRIFFVWPKNGDDGDDSGTYDGDAVGGKKHGRGVQTWGSDRKRVYSGQYEDGMEHGFGTLTEAVGSSSDDYEDNQKNQLLGGATSSRLQQQQHTKYRGQFRFGKRHGYGMQIWTDKTYDGEWESNMVHGRGKLTWNNGACYTGGFQMGRYHGSGCYRNPASGRKYVGQWEDGRKEGVGKQYWPNGDVYHGHFVCGKRHGYGQMRYANGRVYSGGWKEGRRSGRGIEITKDGNVVHCGEWKSNRVAPRIVSPTKRRVQADMVGKAKDDCDFHWMEMKRAQPSEWQVKDAESVFDFPQDNEDDEAAQGTNAVESELFRHLNVASEKGIDKTFHSYEDNTNLGRVDPRLDFGGC